MFADTSKNALNYFKYFEKYFVEIEWFKQCFEQCGPLLGQHRPRCLLTRKHTPMISRGPSQDRPRAAHEHPSPAARRGASNGETKGHTTRQDRATQTKTKQDRDPGPDEMRRGQTRERNSRQHARRQRKSKPNRDRDAEGSRLARPSARAPAPTSFEIFV